ncbi:hypothetical protein PM082_024456 [Marasmius tenuissimus]|nr:hypothetical protein PM082_024456 [Marasmius tenuissimus]
MGGSPRAGLFNSVGMSSQTPTMPNTWLKWTTHGLLPVRSGSRTGTATCQRLVEPWFGVTAVPEPEPNRTDYFKQIEEILGESSLLRYESVFEIGRLPDDTRSRSLVMRVYITLFSFTRSRDLAERISLQVSHMEGSVQDILSV